MARNIVVVLLAMISVVVAYQTRYDQIDVDAIISNKRILTSFIKCFMDEGPCTGEAKDIKDILPEVIDTKCTDCSDVQKKLMRKAVSFIMTDRPDDWKRLTDKYDPQHVHDADLQQFLAETAHL